MTADTTTARSTRLLAQRVFLRLVASMVEWKAVSMAGRTAVSRAGKTAVSRVAMRDVRKGLMCGMHSGMTQHL
jgi:hypothetical protein